MLALGLLLPICFIPGYTGASIPTQWVLLSLALPATLWMEGPRSSIHLLGLGFIGWAILTAFFSVNGYTSVYGMWFVIIWALSFWLGTVSATLRRLWQGLAIGMTISTAVAVAQVAGYSPVLINGTAISWHAPGLLFNTSLAGVSCAMVLAGLIGHRLWWYTPGPLLGLALSHSRGGALLFALALVARYTHWLFALALLVAGSLAFSLDLAPSDGQRLQIWGYAIRNLSLLGHGPFAFSHLYYMWYDAAIHTVGSVHLRGHPQ